MAIKYIATFADGSTHKRTSASGRIYSHCWRVQYVTQGGSPNTAAGFSGSRDLAAAEVRKIDRWSVPGSTRSEIVEAVVVQPRAVKS